MNYSISWDFDTFERSLRRGFGEYNFYSIFLDRSNEYWRRIDPDGNMELYYIGSTRTQNVTHRLLNKHDGLKGALRDGFGEIAIALGKLKIDEKRSIKQWNDIVYQIEAALIHLTGPTANITNRVKYKGPDIEIDNHLRSYYGISLEDLVFDGTMRPIDALGFADHIKTTISPLLRGSIEFFDAILIELFAEIERRLTLVNDKIGIRT